MNRRNFVPVNVWKHVNRNLSVSRLSRPVAGIPGLGNVNADAGVVGVGVPGVEGILEEVGVVAVVEAVERGSLGVIVRVMA